MDRGSLSITAGCSFSYHIWQELAHICAPHTQTMNNEKKGRESRGPETVHDLFSKRMILLGHFERETAFCAADIHQNIGNRVLSYKKRRASIFTARW